MHDRLSMSNIFKKLLSRLLQVFAELVQGDS